METSQLADAAYRRDLGDGLVVRWSTSSDVENLVYFLSHVIWRRDPAGPPSATHAAWTRDLMSGRHPQMGPADFAVVEDTQSGTIVACTCLFSTTWEYEGIPFGVGRPELVASHPDYRDRGFVRTLFNMIHARSAAGGHLVQVISGIPYFYRQFGYQYAVEMPAGRRLDLDAVVALTTQQDPGYSLRHARPADIPFLLAMYAEQSRGSLVVQTIDARHLLWEMEGIDAQSSFGRHHFIVLGPTGQSVGCVATDRLRMHESLNVLQIAIHSDVSMTAVLPVILHTLIPSAASPTGPIAAGSDAPSLTGINLRLGDHHAAYTVAGDLAYQPPELYSYAWFVRLGRPDLFLVTIAPVLERRLAASALAGYTGDLLIDLYRTGLQLTWHNGRLEHVAAWRRSQWGDAHVSIPPEAFVQLVFGYRTIEDLHRAFPDFWLRVGAPDIPDLQSLLRILFPLQSSWLVELD